MQSPPPKKDDVFPVFRQSDAALFKACSVYMRTHTHTGHTSSSCVCSADHIIEFSNRSEKIDTDFNCVTSNRLEKLASADKTQGETVHTKVFALICSDMINGGLLCSQKKLSGAAHLLACLHPSRLLSRVLHDRIQDCSCVRRWSRDPWPSDWSQSDVKAMSSSAALFGDKHRTRTFTYERRTLI